MKLRQYLAIFPSHFNNIYLKSFRLLQNLSKNNKILRKSMIFHKTNVIHKKIVIKLCFCSLTMYFVDFRFRFWYFWKSTIKFQSRLNWFEILKFRIWRWQKLKKSISQLPGWWYFGLDWQLKHSLQKSKYWPPFFKTIKGGLSSMCSNHFQFPSLFYFPPLSPWGKTSDDYEDGK